MCRHRLLRNQDCSRCKWSSQEHQDCHLHNEDQLWFQGYGWQLKTKKNWMTHKTDATVLVDSRYPKRKMCARATHSTFSDFGLRFAFVSSLRIGLSMTYSCLYGFIQRIRTRDKISLDQNANWNTIPVLGLVGSLYIARASGVPNNKIEIPIVFTTYRNVSHKISGRDCRKAAFMTCSRRTEHWGRPSVWPSHETNHIHFGWLRTYAPYIIPRGDVNNRPVHKGADCATQLENTR